MARPRLAVSIFSLAREFGVSAPTVSKALSNSTEVSAELRAKLRARADELGFRPKRPRRKSYNICALLDMEFCESLRIEGYTEPVIEGIYRYCNQQGVEFSLYAETTEKLEQIDLSRELYLRNVDGVVIVGASPERKYFRNLDSSKVPYYCIFDGPPARTITVDNLAAGRLALQHLAGLGHRRVAIARQLARRVAASDRFMGFVRAATEYGLPPGAVLELTPPSSASAYDWGRQLLREWLENGRPYTALFALADNVSLGILSEAAVRGVRIPQELSVLTCDDLVSCAEAAPPLSVVDIPNIPAGQAAAQRAWCDLTKSIPEGGIPPVHFPVTRILHRTSTACPP